MNRIARLCSAAALLAVIAPCVLLFAGAIDLTAVKWWALVGTLLWFAVTPLWMGRDLPVDAAEVEI